MWLERLDHVSICTPDVQALKEFYTDVLGMRSGPRPDFSFNGAWMYAGDRPCVHLIERLDLSPTDGDLQMQHFAFSASNLGEFLAHLKAKDVPYRVGIVEDFGICQINVHDPDGNHVHMDFPAADAKRLGVERTPR